MLWPSLINWVGVRVAERPAEGLGCSNHGAGRIVGQRENIILAN